MPNRNRQAMVNDAKTLISWWMGKAKTESDPEKREMAVQAVRNFDRYLMEFGPVDTREAKA